MFSASHRLTIARSSILDKWQGSEYASLSNFLELLIKLLLTQSNKDKYKVTQRVHILKKKTRLTVMNMHSKLLNNLESLS